MSYYLAHKKVGMGFHEQPLYFEATVENLCAFIATRKLSENFIITDAGDNLVLTTMGMFIDKCPDKQFLVEQLHPIIIPFQTGEKEIPTVIFKNED